jgi:hypothetical protein
VERLVVEKALARHEPAARDPREARQLAHLDMCGVRVVERVLGAVAAQPRPRLVGGGGPVAPAPVDEQLVPGQAQPPAATYCARWASLSTAWAEASRASGTRYGEQLT